MKTDKKTCWSSYWMTDVIKDVLCLTMFMCSMLSPGLLNPNVSCMFSLILIKRHPQIPLVGLNLTRTALSHNITKTRLPYPDVSWKYDKLAPSYQVLRIKPFPNVSVSSTSRNLTISQNLIQSSARWLPHQAQLSLCLSTTKNSKKTQQPFQIEILALNRQSCRWARA